MTNLKKTMDGYGCKRDRENHRIKHPKPEVKTVAAAYLKRRNFHPAKPAAITKDELIHQSSIQQCSGRSNSIICSCYNSDSVAIDHNHNFSKFISWLKDQIKRHNRCQDLEQLIGPLFCHFYIDILKEANTEKALTFFKNHISSVHRDKCDDTVVNLIQLIGSRSDIDEAKEEFRRKKITIRISKKSLLLLKSFVIENCHIAFLQIVQSWFNFRIMDEPENHRKEKKVLQPVKVQNMKENPILKDLRQAVGDLKMMPAPVQNVSVSCARTDVGCGFLKRRLGMIALAENNIVRLMPMHNYNNLLNTGKNSKVQLIHHSARIYAMDISLNNKYFVTGSADCSICIYDLREIRLVKKCLGHLGPVYCVKISYNCGFVASGSMDTTIRLWRTKTGKLMRVIAGHTQSITSIEWHPNTLYVISGSPDKNIRMWCVNTGDPVRLLHSQKGTVYALVFSPDGQCVASASDDSRIRIWDLVTSKVTLELDCKEQKVFRLIWNGNELIAGSADGTIRIWNLKGFVLTVQDGIRKPEARVINLRGKLLSLDYAFKTYGALTYRS